MSCPKTMASVGRQAKRKPSTTTMTVLASADNVMGRDGATPLSRTVSCSWQWDSDGREVVWCAIIWQLY